MKKTVYPENKKRSVKASSNMSRDYLFRRQQVSSEAQRLMDNVEDFFRFYGEAFSGRPS